MTFTKIPKFSSATHQKIKLFLLFIFFSVLILTPFILDPNVIKKNDLNGNTTPLLNFKDSVIEDKQIPQWNSYINQGVPQIADPLYGIYNPIISIPFIFLSQDFAIKITYILSTFLACFFMFLLLRLYKISYLISIIIALTYASSSYLAARISAGHLEKIVSFGLLPLFIFSIIKTIRDKNIIWSGITAIIISLILFSGDIYNTAFALYSISLLAVFYFFKDKKISLYLLASILLFFLFSSIKIIPMIELQSYISKIKEPFIGSQNLISIFYYIFFPFDSLNKIIPTNFFLSNDFGWWESYSFIGPLSIIGLLSVFKISSKKDDTIIIPLLVALFILISMPNLTLNPIHILISNFSFLQFFHVPSRIFALLSVLILLSLGLLLNRFTLRKKIVNSILIINLLISIVFFENTLIEKKFPEIDQENIKAVEYIAKNNPSNFTALHLTSQGDIPQDVAYKNSLLFLQSNYGLFIKNSPSDKYTFGKTPYKDINTGFIVTKSDMEFVDGYKKIDNFKSTKVNIFLNPNGYPFASINKRSYTSTISANKITVYADSKEGEKLIIYQNNYPGWEIYIDNNKAEITEDNLVSVITRKGEHKYEFVFSSKSFLLGSLISFISIGLWGYYLLKKKVNKLIFSLFSL